MGRVKNLHWEEKDGGYVVTSPCAFVTSVVPKNMVDMDEYILGKNGILIVNEGVWWDGASGPAIDTKTNMRASLVHDLLINMVQAGKLDGLRWKVDIDGAYWLYARNDGMNWFRAMYHLLMIQLNPWNKKIREVVNKWK